MDSNLDFLLCILIGYNTSNYSYTFMFDKCTKMEYSCPTTCKKINLFKFYILKYMRTNTSLFMQVKKQKITKKKRVEKQQTKNKESSMIADLHLFILRSAIVCLYFLLAIWSKVSIGLLVMAWGHVCDAIKVNKATHESNLFNARKIHIKFAKKSK